MTARGITIRAAVARPEHTGVIAGPNLIVFRPGPRIVPELIAVLLRHPQTQAALLQSRTGSGTPGFTISQLANLEVSLPDIGSQLQLMEMADLADAHHLAAVTAARLRRDVVHDLVFDALRHHFINPKV